MSAKPGKKEAKAAAPVITVAQDLHVDADLRRLQEACAALGDPLAPFAKRLKGELTRVKDGDQEGVPQVPLFVRGELPLGDLKTLCTAALRPYPFLRVVQLHHALLGDDGILILCEFLREYKPLPDRNPFGIQRLELPGCAISPRGCRYLGGYLRSNATVTRLVLDFNPLEDAGVQELCTGLQWNSCVTSLSLQYCGISATGASHIASRIVKESNVSALSLRGNPLSDKGVEEVAKAVCVSSKLEEVDLADTAFTGDADAVLALCEAIEGSTALRIVDVALCTLTPSASECLLRALQASKHVTALRVSERTDPTVYQQVVDISATRSQAGKKKGKKKAA
ncbi:Leucine Rich repeat [Novymonas esmeraldas]|uniref:Leucine Rich repeat n=1 Tax=Novymonas esmeraldas TaxID=1808958 RepID=A0AAW0ESZ2_9TRYP